jgi:hypothetical protein
LSLQLDALARAGQKSAVDRATGGLGEQFLKEMLTMLLAVGRDQVEHVETDGLGLAVTQGLAPGWIHELDPAIDADQLDQITGVLEKVEE